MLSQTWSDIRYAVRTLRRSPGFTLAAVVPIALGVGINTGIFSILEGAVLRPLPTPESNALVSIYQTLNREVRRYISGSRSMLSFPEYEVYRDRSRTLSGVMAYSRPWAMTLGGDVPQEIEGQLVTCNYFDVLRVKPALGLGFTPANCDVRGIDPPVVLGHDLWVSRFGSDPEIVGTSVVLNRQPLTVVGIAPRGFHGTWVVKVAFFTPVSALNALRPDQPDYRAANQSWLSLIGRRAEGIAIDQVRAELGVIARQIDLAEPGRATTLSIDRATILGLPEARREVLTGAMVVLAAFGLVLLIACANVANLLLARAAGRSQEIVLRLALGASRTRVIRQLLTESVMLAAIGGAAGFVLAWWSFQVLLTLILSSLPGMIPPLSVTATPNLTVLAFSIGITMVTGVLFGLAPAVHASRPDVHSAIKQATGGSAWRGGWLRGSLVTVQVAVCMTLLISASLLLRALYAAQTIEPGFDYRNVAVVSFDLPGSGYDAQKALGFQREMMERVRAIPGVESVAQVIKTPLSPGRMGMMFHLPGDAQWHEVDFNAVSPEYFALLRIPIVRGRTFTPGDLNDGSRAGIVTEATARRYWPNADPIGQTMMLGVGPGEEAPVEIVGVTSDVQIGRVAEVESSYLYRPATPRGQAGMKLVVRSRNPFTALAPAIRSAGREIDSALALRVTPLEDNLDYWRSVARLVAGLSGSLSALALILCSVGVYGVISYVVSRRMREVGIRMMLGATAREVQRMMLRQTMRPVLIGMAIGMAAAAGISRVLQGVLFGVDPVDPLAFIAAAAFLTAVAGVAGLIPARRAMSLDPAATLRCE